MARPMTPKQEDLLYVEPIEDFKIKFATNDADFDSARDLFTRYVASLRVDLTFQNFTREVASLPGQYAEPTGCILLAYSSHSSLLSAANPPPIPIGCVGLRPLPNAPMGEKICEMKRPYCVPEARKLGVGKALAEAVIREAEMLGYGEMRLDTLPSMVGARRLYEKLGFEGIEGYYETPLAGTIFLARKIGGGD